MLKRTALILLSLLITVLVCTELTVAQNPVSDVAVKGAVLCWNEAGPNPFDCSAIIEMRMRSARRSGRTLAEELYHLHGDGRTNAPTHAALRSDRATNVQRHDSRPWLGDIALDLHQPRHWNSDDASWLRYSRDFQRMFRLVQDVIDGRQHSRCRGGYPIRWGGPRVDAHLVEQHLENGEVIIDCGNTRNVFLGIAR